MVTISKADYLKKYLSGAGDDEKKKRKKKKEKDQKTKQTGMKIVEDEAFITVRTEARSDSDDEEEMEMIEELKRKARKGPRFKKTFLSAGDDEVIEVKQEPLSDEEGPISFQIKQKESSDPKVKQEVDSDVSPRRKKENHTSEKSHRKRHDSDDNSPPRRRTRHDSDDNSPPRRRVRHDSDDNSPPRRRVRHDSDDKSPPRRRVRHDSDDKSPPRRRARHDSDASPPRKKHGRSPVRRPRHDSDDASPQRRRKDRDTDRSPPRRKRHDSDNSPPRRRGDAVKDDSPRRKKKRYDSDESPPRRSAADIKKSPASSPPRRRIASPEVGKQRKTLDGKVAGLQSAKDLKAETEKLKRKEDALFDFMDPDLSGKNAATVHREKQVGRRKNNTEDQDKKEREQKKQEELQEKYSSWNKGVHQLEERKAKLEELARVVQEPLTRTADDVAMNAHLKHQLYEEDPLHKLIAKNRRHKAIDRGESVYPTYDKPFPPNRFGIRPGYRWDGVDRSNQFEAKLYISKNQKQSDNTSYYQNLGLYE